MWLPACPEKSAGLRQGDFLSGLMLPRLIWPLYYARPPEGPIARNQTVVLSASQPYGYLVVSQCCTIENQAVAALAEVKSSKPLSAEELDDYEREEPVYSAEDDEINGEGTANPRSGYVFNAHALAPFGQYLERVGGRIYIADLTTIQTYAGNISDFQEARVAAMSPVGRRSLRIRLALFWGRAEAEDEQWLIEHGIPVGEWQPAPAQAVPGEAAPAEAPPEGAQVETHVEGAQQAQIAEEGTGTPKAQTATNEPLSPPPELNRPIAGPTDSSTPQS